MQTRSQTKRLELELLGPPSPLWPLSEQFPGARAVRAARCVALRAAPLQIGLRTFPCLLKHHQPSVHIQHHMHENDRAVD